MLVNAGGALVFPLVAILLSFVIGAVIVMATGNNPITVYAALIGGAFGSASSIGRTLLYTTPFIFTGLAVAVAFRAGLFNNGGQARGLVGLPGPLRDTDNPRGLPDHKLPVGLHPGDTQGALRRARGDHHDYAELRRHQPGVLPGPASAPAERAYPRHGDHRLRSPHPHHQHRA